MDQLFQFMSGIVPLTDAFKHALEKEVVIVPFRKNHVLLNIAQVAEHAYFLNSGFAMAFQYIEGIKHIEEFYDAGRIIVSPTSFFEQRPSQESIQLLERSEVIHITHESVTRLLKAFPEANIICRATLNHYYEESRRLIYEFRHLSAEERYEKLMKKYPKLEQLIPQDYIASYLGIAPQSLGRIKRGIKER